MANKGSPPRVRGHAECCLFRNRELRITPAGAGTWNAAYWAMGLMWDHPRGCGDMVAAGDALNEIDGSPPRVRGHARTEQSSQAVPRITPAGAGTCCRSPLSGHTAGDHPRGCGDMFALVMLVAMPSGSPPRVRGHVR